MRKGELKGTCNSGSCCLSLVFLPVYRHRFNGKYYCQGHAIEINAANMYWDGKDLGEKITGGNYEFYECVRTGPASTRNDLQAN